jgi:hypothetical protein
MSLANAKNSMATALASVSWTIPAAASGIAYASATAFRRIDTEQFGEDVPDTQVPLARIHVPSAPDARFTMGGDNGSYKIKNYTAFLFIYWACFAKDWNGGGQYFDAVIDATQSYFDRHASAPGQTTISPGNGVILAWGLKSDARVELPERFEEGLYFRATVGIDITEVTI